MAADEDGEEAVEHVRTHILPGSATYNRLSVIQPLTHETTPWSHWVLSFFYIGLWYTVINQFMIQRVLAARSLYDARMGIVFAGFLKTTLFNDTVTAIRSACVCAQTADAVSIH